MNTIDAIVKAVNSAIALSDQKAAKGLNAAGWAFHPYVKTEDITLAMRVSAFLRYSQGIYMLEPAEVVVDRISGKPIFKDGPVQEGRVTTFYRGNFFKEAKTALDGALFYGRARNTLEENGVKLRNRGQLLRSIAAKKDYYATRDALKPITDILKHVSETLLSGEHAVQERTLGRVLQGTVLEGTVSPVSRKHLSVDQVVEIAKSLSCKLDELRAEAFDVLNPVTSISQAKDLLKDAGVRELVEEGAEQLVRQLYNTRFWLAFQLTQGELTERVYMVKEIFELMESIEDNDAAMDMFGYYDSYEYNTDARDMERFYTPDIGETTDHGQALSDYSRMSETLTDLGEVASLHDVQGDYWEDHGQRVSLSTFATTADTSLQDVDRAGKIPVSINRAALIEQRVKKLQGIKRELDDIARLLGKRANDEDWIIKTHEFNMLDMEENALRLLVPTALQAIEDSLRVDMRQVRVDLEQVADMANDEVRYF